MKIEKLIFIITNSLLFFTGLIISGFASVILITGMDEIWNGFSINWGLISIIGLFYSIGISFIVFAFNKENRAPKIFGFLVIFFFVSAIVSFFLS